MSASATAAVPTGIPGVNGQCGYQHSFTPCLPIVGQKLCCSVNGYCGTTPEFCLVSAGCQYGCDPLSSGSSTSSPTPTPSPTSLTSTTKPSTTSSHSTSSTILPISTAAPEEASHGISHTAKVGAIAGGVVGCALLLALLIFCCLWQRNKRRKSAEVARRAEDAENMMLQREMQERDRRAAPVEGANVHDGPIVRPSSNLRYAADGE